MPPKRRATRGSLKPFDATTKYLLEVDPAAWLEYAGVELLGPVVVVDANVSTITAEADKVVRIDGPQPWLAHLELQSSADPTLEARLSYYNCLLHRRHGLPVQSIAVLPRPEADRPRMSGLLRQRLPDGTVYLRFRYTAVRTWEQPLEPLLSGSLATVPLAPLAAGAERELPAIIDRMRRRLGAETSEQVAAQLWTATYLLMGLRYPEGATRELLKGVRAMQDSVTYQAILREGEARGRVDGARRILLRAGANQLGPVDRRTTARLEQITDIEQLETLIDRLREVTSWDDLLAGA